ncbi:hypothetical protein ABPG72_015412 [Tetrahymena utriculariae]
MDSFSTKSQINQIIDVDDANQSSSQNEISNCAKSLAKDDIRLLRDLSQIIYSQYDAQNNNKDLLSYREQKSAYQKLSFSEFKADPRQQIRKEYSNQINKFKTIQQAQPESQKMSNNSMNQIQQVDEKQIYKQENAIKSMKRFLKFSDSFKDYNTLERKLVIFSFLKIQKKVCYIPNHIEAFINIDDSDQLNLQLQQQNLMNEFLQFLKEQKQYSKSLFSYLKQFIQQRNQNDSINLNLNEDIYQKNKYSFSNQLNRLQKEKSFKKFFDKVYQINSPESKKQVCPDIPIYHYITILREFTKKYNNNNQYLLLEEQVQTNNSQDSNQQISEKTQETTTSHNQYTELIDAQIIQQKNKKTNEVNTQSDKYLLLIGSNSKQDNSNNNKGIKKNLSLKILQKMNILEIQNAENQQQQNLNNQILLDILQVLQNQRDDQTKFNKLIYESIQELINNIKKQK